MKIGEFFVQLGFKSDQTKLVDFIHSLGELNLSTITASLGLGGVYEGLKRVMEQADKTAVSLNLFQKTTGLSGEKSQQFATFVQEQGGSFDTTLSSLKSLEEHILKVNTAQESGEGFAKLGIMPTDTFDVLEQIHKRVTDPVFMNAWAKTIGLSGSNAEETKKTFESMALSTMGIDSSLMLGLNTSEDVWKTWVKINTVSQENIDKLMELHKFWVQIGNNIKIIIADIGGDFTADMKALAQVFIAITGEIEKWHKMIKPVANILAGIALLFPQTRIASAVFLGATNMKSIQDYSKSSFGKGLASQNAGMFVDPLTLVNALIKSGQGNRTNNVSIHIQGNEPHTIGQEVKKVIERLLGQGHYQNPLPYGGN